MDYSAKVKKNGTAQAVLKYLQKSRQLDKIVKLLYILRN